MNPVYNEGNFLGTDDGGLHGEAIVMGASSFTQGMSNADALKAGTLFSKFSGSDEVRGLISDHHGGLSSRPDWDGIVTIAEGIAWAKSHPNSTGSANDALYLDALKMDFGSLSMDDFQAFGQVTDVDLLLKTNMLSAASRNTTYALGRTKMTLLTPLLGGVVKVENGSHNAYDWNYGGSPLRQALIFANRLVSGLNDSHGVPVHVYGVGLLNK
jgi:hypothetical protein